MISTETFQKKTNSQQVYENIFNITNHQKTANQSTMRYHFVPVTAIIKKDYKYY